MAHRLFSISALLFLLASCRQEPATLMLVKVLARDGVVSPPEASARTRTMTSLEAVFIQDQDRIPQVLSQGGEIALPTSFVLRADGREGPIQIDLAAKDDHQQTLGAASVSGVLVKDQQGELAATLLPSDFGINQNHEGRQLFSTEAGFGREVASSSGGSFVVVWEDYNCGPLMRCDVWYRLFDRTGTPKLNVDKTDERAANESNDVYDMPTVAAQDNGSFLIAWERQVGNKFKIFSRTFTPDGRPDPSSSSGAEVELSGTEISSSVIALVPHAVALRDGGYLVVWQQTSPTVSWDLKARYLGPNGVPTAIYTGSKEPFTVHSFGTRPATCDNGKCDAGETCMTCPNDCIGCGPWPVAAAGTDQGFLVAWNEDGMVRGKTYRPRATPNKGPFDVDSAKTTKVREVMASPMGFAPAGYAVVWSDTVASGPDTDGTCIRLQRLDLSGGPVQPGEQEFTLNTSSAGNQRTPAVASRTDGSLLVSWSTDHPTPDPEGGIRGRLVLHNMLPIGLDFPLNTTTVGKQEAPALAKHLDEGYVLVFVDSSRTYPDQLDSGIRGRLLYPDFGVQDGLLGALCTEKPCGTGLSCQDTSAGRRCLATCASVGASCVQGGVCQTVPITGERVCQLP